MAACEMGGAIKNVNPNRPIATAPEAAISVILPFSYERLVQARRACSLR